MGQQVDDYFRDRVGERNPWIFGHGRLVQLDGCLNREVTGLNLQKYFYLGKFDSRNA